MNARWRLVASAIALLIPTLVLGRWILLAGRSDLPDSAFNLDSTLGAWEFEAEETLSEEVLAQIDPDAYVFRRYQAPNRNGVWIYAGLYGGRANYGKSPHDPNVCYPAQGWEVTARRPVEIRPSPSESFEATLLRANKGAAQEVVLYWFQPADRWPSGPALEQLLHIRDALFGRTQYAFVRLSARVTSGDTRDDLLDFAGRVAVAIRAQVESGEPTLGVSTAVHASNENSSRLTVVWERGHLRGIATPRQWGR